MKVASGNKTYFIKKTPSIYTTRNNATIKLEDVSIFESGHDHGIRLEGEDGLFVTIAKFTAEDGSVIRSYSALPKEITPELLKQWGFVE